MLKIIKNNYISVIFIVCLTLMVTISASTTLYGDDFIYGTYLFDGFFNFLKRSYDHYVLMNGRAFVHFMLELVLFFGDRLFFVVIPLLLISVFYVFEKVFKQSGSQFRRSHYYTIALILIMTLSNKVIREGILWISGAFNYIFPVIFSGLAFYIIKKNIKSKKLIPWTLPVMFLCGQTTEQCGAMAISLVVLYIIYSYFNKKKIGANVLVPVLFLIAGYLSVILSPATSMRVGDEITTELSFFARINLIFNLAFDGIDKVSIIGCAGTLALLSFLKNKNKHYYIISTVLIIVAFVLSFFGMSALAGWIFSITTISSVFYSLYLKTEVEKNILYLSALMSVGMLVFSTTFGYRNFVPFLMVSASIISIVLSEKFYVKKSSQNYKILLMFLVAMIFFIPNFKGYINNRKIINQNLHNLENRTDGFYYNTGIDKRYAYNDFYIDSFYEEGFRKIYGLTPEDKIYLVGEEFLDLYCNETHCGKPIFMKNDTLYYPMREIIEAFGGKVSYIEDKKCSAIFINDTTLLYDNKNKLFSINDKIIDATDYVLVDNKYGDMFNSSVYMKKEAFFDIFSLELD